MYTKRRLPALLFPLSLACASCLVFGCKDSRRHQPTDAVAAAAGDPVLPADASPQDVVKYFLTSARTVQHIRASGFAKTDTQDEYIQGLAALHAAANRLKLFEHMRTSRSARALPAGMTEEAAVTVATESWLSILAHYIDGIRMDSIRLTSRNTPEALVAQIDVQAENPDEVAALATLETSPEIVNAKDASGNPIAAGTPAYQELVRERALQLDPPIMVPLRAVITISLARSAPDDRWGIVSVRVGPPAIATIYRDTRVPPPEMVTSAPAS